MKKLLLFVLIGIAAGIMSVTASAAPSTDPFKGDNEINIVYLGGSITYGAGASNTGIDLTTRLMNENGTSYAALVGKYLKDTYETDQRQVNNYNEGISGTPSGYGMARLKTDVLSHNPDMVFVEFCVNDKYYTEEQVYNFMESIVLTLQQQNDPPYIAFIDTTQQDMSTNTAYHNAVANFYGIPVIDLKSIIQNDSSFNADYFNSSNKVFWKDGTHPTDLGYKYYADKIESVLGTSDGFKKPLLKDDKISVSGKTVYGVNTSSTDGNSSISAPSWSVDGAYLKYTGADPGSDELTFTFSGNTLCVMQGATSSAGDGGTYNMTIDGVNYRELEGKTTGFPQNNGSGTTPITNVSVVYTGLGYGLHKAVITPDASNATGNKVTRFNGFITEDPSLIAETVDLLDIRGKKINSIVGNNTNIVYTKLQNLTDKDRSLLGIVATYDERGVLKGVSTMRKNVKAYSEDNFGIEFLASGISSASVYMFNDFNGIVPMDKKYTR